MKYGDQINSKIDYNRDFNYDFFGFKTLEKSYLLKAVFPNLSSLGHPVSSD